MLLGSTLPHGSWVFTSLGRPTLFDSFRRRPATISQGGGLMMRNNVGRSDLDVFEGLGNKKSAALVSRAPSPSSVPPPPPPAVRRVQGVPRASAKQSSSGRSPFAQPPLP